MSLSVFAGLLFNLLLLVYDIIGKPNSNKRPLRATLLKELSSNISFGILISVVTIILLLVFSLATTSDVLTNHNVISNNINISSNNTNEAYDFALLDAQTMPYLLAFLIYYLVSIFILNLFMILKRFHIILRSEFKRDTSWEKCDLSGDVMTPLCQFRERDRWQLLRWSGDDEYELYTVIFRPVNPCTTRPHG